MNTECSDGCLQAALGKHILRTLPLSGGQEFIRSSGLTRPVHCTWLFGGIEVLQHFSILSSRRLIDPWLP